MSPNVPLRQLGKNGPMVTALGFGTMGMSFAYGDIPSDEERFKLLDRAYELGCTNWDCADLYGDAEEVLGKWFTRTGKREDIFLASKFGILKDATGALIGLDTSAAYVKKACEASLERMHTDHIDLYYAHRVNPDVPVEETVRAMVELKNEGKIRHLGLSEVSSTTLRRACKVHHIAAVQIEYSPMTLDIESDQGTNLLATARELGVAVIAYSPLGRGLLTGAITSSTDISQPGDWRAFTFPRFQGENLTANLKLAKQFAAIAEKKGCTPGQLALAWLLKQGDDIIPIPGTKKIKYLEQNWGALQVELTDEENAEIRKFAETADAMGTRYSEAQMSNAFSNTVEER